MKVSHPLLVTLSEKVSHLATLAATMRIEIQQLEQENQHLKEAIYNLETPSKTAPRPSNDD